MEHLAQTLMPIDDVFAANLVKEEESKCCLGNASVRNRKCRFQMFSTGYQYGQASRRRRRTYQCVEARAVTSLWIKISRFALLRSKARAEMMRDFHSFRHGKVTDTRFRVATIDLRVLNCSCNASARGLRPKACQNYKQNTVGD